MRPRIGITGPDRGGVVAWFFTAMNILLAGGKPVRIRPVHPKNPDKLHGLILGGGADVDPKSYTEDDFIREYIDKTLKARKRNIFQRIGLFIGWLYYPFLFLLRKLFSRKSFKISEERDELEFNILDKAVKKRLPVLGICRGSQIINVYFKGTLHKDINIFYFEEPNRYSIFPVKQVFIKPGSKLRKILNTPELLVNALHHQAVKEEGEKIDIVAREKNQVVQGIEHLQQDFILGVQWHPEYLINRKKHRRIFHELVKAAEVKMIEGSSAQEGN